MADEGQSGERVSLGALFTAFLRVSLRGFGGGIVWAHRIAVEQRRWINEEEFADVLSSTFRIYGGWAGHVMTQKISS
jgi:chromate transport protein ChrA